MKHNFNERKQNRIGYAKEQAGKNREKSESLHRTANEMASAIPMGQPILIGHHSEKYHRKHLEKIRNTVRKAFNATDKANYYEQRAAAIESNDAIYSDDTKAVELITKKIEQLEKLQEFMKSANKFIRKKDKESFMKMEGTSEKLWEELNKPDFLGSLGFPSYKLKNNNANIRRYKIRRDELEKQENISSESFESKGVTVVKNVEANRIQLFFPHKPSEKVRNDLSKKYSFKWCRSEGAWQRHLNNAGIYALKCFLKNYEE